MARPSEHPTRGRASTHGTADPVGAQHVAPARPCANPRPRPDDDLPTVISVASLSKVYGTGDIDGRTLCEDLARRWVRFRGSPDSYLGVGQGDRANRDGECTSG